MPLVPDSVPVIQEYLLPPPGKLYKIADFAKNNGRLPINDYLSIFYNDPIRFSDRTEVYFWLTHFQHTYTHRPLLRADNSYTRAMGVSLNLLSNEHFTLKQILAKDVANDFIKSLMKSRSLPKHNYGKIRFIPLWCDTAARQKNKNITLGELNARKALRDLITEAEWLRYLKRQWINVKGPSSNYKYAINPYSNVLVFDKGKRINSLCIHTDSSCPPTDHVLNVKLMIENDEDSLWHGSNVRDDNHRVIRMPVDFFKEDKDWTLVDYYKDQLKTYSGMKKSVYGFCFGGYIHKELGF